MCGPASPITCDNALRRNNITHVTKLIDCVWGCFCASGHLRSNHNGKCVPETECIKDNHVELSAQVPGVFRLGFHNHFGGGGSGTYYPAGTDNNAGYGNGNWNNGGGNGGGNGNGGGGCTICSPAPPGYNWNSGPPNGWYNPQGWNWNNGPPNGYNYGNYGYPYGYNPYGYNNGYNGGYNNGGYNNGGYGGWGNTTYNFINNGNATIGGSNNCNGTDNCDGTNTGGSVDTNGK